MSQPLLGRGVIKQAALYLLGGLLIGLAVGLGMFLGLPGQRSSGSSEGRQAGAIEGQEVPGFTLRDARGQEHSLVDYRGRVVLLNFWATWCAPCRLEMPAIQERYERYGANELAVLAVNFDEPQSQVVAFGEELGLSFPLLLDPGGEVQRMYRIRGYPTSVFVDEEGIVRVVHIGIMTEDQLDEALQELGIGAS